MRCIYQVRCSTTAVGTRAEMRVAATVAAEACATAEYAAGRRNGRQRSRRWQSGRRWSRRRLGWWHVATVAGTVAMAAAVTGMAAGGEAHWWQCKWRRGGHTVEAAGGHGGDGEGCHPIARWKGRGVSSAKGACIRGVRVRGNGVGSNHSVTPVPPPAQ